MTNLMKKKTTLVVVFFFDVMAYLKANRLWVFVFGGSLTILAGHELGLFSILPPCLWKSLTGFECWACGSTTAFLHLLQGDFASAFQAQKSIFISAPSICFFVLRDFFEFRKKVVQKRDSQHKS